MFTQGESAIEREGKRDGSLHRENWQVKERGRGMVVYTKALIIRMTFRAQLVGTT